MDDDVASVNACISSSPWAHGLQLLGALRLRRLRATVVTGGALLSSPGAWFRALAALRAFAARRLETNAIGMSAAVRGCTAWPWAVHLVEHSEASVVSANALITCCQRASEALRALELLRGLEGDGG